MEIQKADIWKRISAWLFDVILLLIVTVGFATAVSAIVNYDKYSAELTAHYERYEQQFGIDLFLSEEDFNKLSEEEQTEYKNLYQQAMDEFAKDEAVQYTNSMIFNLALVILNVSILLGYLVVYFLVPVLFKNGQTLGKKIFGIAVMRAHGVKLPNSILFVRSIIGQCVIGTLVPIYFGLLGGIGIIMLILLLLLQLGLFFFTQNRSTIHDLLSYTVAVDMASQRIFENEADLIAYKTALEEEKKAQEAMQA